MGTDDSQGVVAGLVVDNDEADAMVARCATQIVDEQRNVGRTVVGHDDGSNVSICVAADEPSPLDALARSRRHSRSHELSAIFM